MNAGDNNILVVGDTSESVGVLAGLLACEGYRVLLADDGESALEQARAANPVVVLIDIMASDPGSFDVCRVLKAAPATADIPVLFITTPGDREYKLRGFDAGGADYVEKPLERREVLARVRAHGELRRMQVALSAAHRELERKATERTSELECALREREGLRDRLQHENRSPRQGLCEQANHREAGNGSVIYKLQDVERLHFIAVLKKTRGVIEGPNGAAKLLDLKPSTARFRIKKLGIRRDDILSAAPPPPVAEQ